MTQNQLCVGNSAAKLMRMVKPMGAGCMVACCAYHWYVAVVFFKLFIFPVGVGNLTISGHIMGH